MNDGGMFLDDGGLWGMNRSFSRRCPAGRHAVVCPDPDKCADEGRCCREPRPAPQENGEDGALTALTQGAAP